jgi:hypothetical protein
LGCNVPEQPQTAGHEAERDDENDRVDDHAAIPMSRRVFEMNAWVFAFTQQ